MPPDPRPAARQRELRFILADVERFAAASGDVNPLHVDSGFARRTPFGECIVHGALVAVGMLGVLPPEALARVGAVRAWFTGPVIPGAAGVVVATESTKMPGAWEIRLSGRGKPLVRLVAGTDPERIAPGLDDPTLGERLAAARAEPMRRAPAEPMRRAPAELGLEEMVPGSAAVGDYRPSQDLAALAAQFGAESLDPALCESLAWASYLVGMELPGLHSLFSGVRLARLGADPGEDPSGRYAFELRDHDVRTGQLTLLGVRAGGPGGSRIGAKIECFARTPTGPPDPAALGLSRGVPGSDPPPPDRGAVVVIGASRGFGAALSLALLARGYEVHGAHSSSGSAEALAELAGPAARRLHLHQLDAGDPQQIGALVKATGGRRLAGLVLNAALPPLPLGLTAESADELADYVAASLRLAAVPLGALLPRLDTDGGWVMFSSSSALSAPPRDWPHYVSAKAALEGLASWVAETSPGLRTVILRPPAMRTEMTNTPSGRIVPMAPETIANWVADRIAGGELTAGLSRLEPGPVAAR